MQNDLSEIFIQKSKKDGNTKEKFVNKIINYLFPKKKIVIFDLDGVISDDRKRRYIAHEGTRNINWVKYFRMCPMDPPMKELYPLLKAYKIIFFSGRSESCKEDTKKWIEDNFPGIDYSIIFRPYKSRKPTYEIKEDMLKYISSIGINTEDIYFAVDDDHKVCDMYISHGIKTLRTFFYV